MPKPYAYLGLALWTAAVALVGIAPWLVGVYLGPARVGGCWNPGAPIAAVIGGSFFVSAVLSPICVMPACIGYIIGVQRADRGYPARVIPREAR